MKMSWSPYLRALDHSVLVFDGAMGTQLMELELSDEDFGGAAYHGCNEALVLTRPNLIRQIHEAYFAAGADVVETDTFTASRLKLDEYGLGHRVAEINRDGARLAREAAALHSTPERRRFVAGSMGPTGMLISSSDPTLSKITFDELADLYGEQARHLVEGGVDLSGGEWQKIALARAYFRDAQLVILDEPTASLDARSEKEVFERFAELTQGKTALLISHRFSSVRMSDRIVVLEDGHIAEEGSHERLVALGGRYARMFEMQASHYR